MQRCDRHIIHRVALKSSSVSRLNWNWKIVIYVNYNIESSFFSDYQNSCCCSCSIATKIRNISKEDIPAPVLEKVLQSIVVIDGRNCSYAKAYRVVRHSDFTTQRSSQSVKREMVTQLSTKNPMHRRTAMGIFSTFL